MTVELRWIYVMCWLGQRAKSPAYLGTIKQDKNLQTRILTFPEQEKLLEKLNLRYLKTKKLNIKNPQIKCFPCLKYVIIYRPDLHDFQTRKKQLKK